MRCTECGREFVPDCDEEEICGPCQVQDLPEAQMILTEEEIKDYRHCDDAEEF